MISCRPDFGNRSCIARIGLLLLVVAVLSSCGKRSVEIRLIELRLPFDKTVATNFAELLDAESAVNVKLIESISDNESAMDALLADRADIALLSNNQPFHPDLNTVMPLYANVLHIAYNTDTEPVDLRDLLISNSVYAGPPGSPSRVMLDTVSQGRLQLDDVDYVDITENPCPDVVILFAPIAPGLLEPAETCRKYRLLTLADPAEIGYGSIVDAVSLLSPKLRPFIIPKGTYTTIEAGAIVTFAVDKLLVARSDVPEPIIYDLISEILRLRPALAAKQPGLFHDIRDDFDIAGSAFITHPGAQAYLQRDAPTVYERYSGVAEVAVTVLIGLLSGAFAMIRIYNIRRKNRIDVFYKDAIDLRNTIDEASTLYARKVAIGKMRELQSKAFDMLVDEKVAADESFRIFITLSNDIVDDLRRDPE